MASPNIIDLAGASQDLRADDAPSLAGTLRLPATRQGHAVPGVLFCRPRTGAADAIAVIEVNLMDALAEDGIAIAEITIETGSPAAAKAVSMALAAIEERDEIESGRMAIVAFGAAAAPALRISGGRHIALLSAAEAVDESGEVDLDVLPACVQAAADAGARIIAIDGATATPNALDTPGGRSVHGMTERRDSAAAVLLARTGAAFGEAAATEVLTSLLRTFLRQPLPAAG